MKGIVRTKTFFGLLLGAVVLAAGVSAAIALSGSGRVDSDRASVLHYLKARYALEWRLLADMPTVTGTAVNESRRLGGQCAGTMIGAPHDAAFGALNAEALWVLRVAMWRSSRSMVDHFVKAMQDTAWNGSALEGLAYAVVREEAAKSALALRDVCGDMKAWKARGYAPLSQQVGGYLGRIGKVLAIGARVAAGSSGVVGHTREHCVPVRRGITRCSAEREPLTASETLLRLIGRHEHGEPLARSMVRRILVLERHIARREQAAYVRAGAGMTRAIGLESAMLRVLSPAT